MIVNIHVDVKKCLLSKPDDLGSNFQVSCKNMVNCNNCINAIQSTVIQGVNYNECDTCETRDINDPKSGCKVYTRDPYIVKNNVAEFHPNATI